MDKEKEQPKEQPEKSNKSDKPGKPEKEPKGFQKPKGSSIQDSAPSEKEHQQGLDHNTLGYDSYKRRG